MKLVYVLNQRGTPLMPTKRYGWVRRTLNKGLAKVVKAEPFTIQLLYDTTEYVQPAVLGTDEGYSHIGFSAVNETTELISGELKLLDGQVERIRDRLKYRRIRRSHLRYRKPRFDNRKIEKGWLAPSLQNKYDTHMRLIEKIKGLIPIKKIILEVAAFDIQKIKNPDIQGIEYQQGDQMDFWNLREYILHRDNHECQCPKCVAARKKRHSKNTAENSKVSKKKKTPDEVLCVHHAYYWQGDHSDNPARLVTISSKCHTPRNHQKGQLLWGWDFKAPSYKPETFMTTIRWKLVNELQCEHTYGYITKSHRITLKLDKTHFNDAFCIAGGNIQNRIEPIFMQQVRRNNRSLQKFYDAKYIDSRTDEKVSGKELFNDRTKRNKNLNTEDLHRYRGEKISKGRISTRVARSPIQPKDIVLFDGKKCSVVGAITHGKYLKLKGLKKTPRIDKVKPLYFKRGLACI